MFNRLRRKQRKLDHYGLTIEKKAGGWLKKQPKEERPSLWQKRRAKKAREAQLSEYEEALPNLEMDKRMEEKYEEFLGGLSDKQLRKWRASKINKEFLKWLEKQEPKKRFWQRKAIEANQEEINARREELAKRFRSSVLAGEEVYKEYERYLETLNPKELEASGSKLYRKFLKWHKKQRKAEQKAEKSGIFGRLFRKKARAPEEEMEREEAIKIEEPNLIETEPEWLSASRNLREEQKRSTGAAISHISTKEEYPLMARRDRELLESEPELIEKPKTTARQKKKREFGKRRTGIGRRKAARTREKEP